MRQPEQTRPPSVDPSATGPVLHLLVEAAVQAHGRLLTMGELLVAQRFLALPPAIGHLYARLLHRVRPTLRDDSLDATDRACLPALLRAQLLDRLVPWSQRPPLLRVAELRAACLQLGLPTAGRKAQLVERLLPHSGYSDRDFLRVRHRDLFQRLQRLFLRHPRADYRVVILDQLGIQRRPAYTPTPGPPAFADRAAMVLWEQARAALDACYQGADPLPALDQALAWVGASPRPTPSQHHFSTRRLAAKLASLGARALERQGQPTEAARVYLHLLADGTLEPGALALRALLALGAAGDPAAAIQLARSWVHCVDPASALAIQRSARRIARRSGAVWTTADPPLQPPLRDLGLPAADRSGRRPCYRVPVAPQLPPLPVEGALVATLAALGRTVLHGESAPWSTLFALLFRDLYFLPVPGMLPVGWLSGPLDLGTPAFAANRAQALDARLRAITQGAAPELARRRFARHNGEALAGARWDLATGDQLATIAAALGGPALAQLLGRLATEGWRARRGLPDLVVLPGPAIQLPYTTPALLGPELLLAEVKGPGDTVRDSQAAWFDLLLRAGAPIELWRVRRLQDGPGHHAAHRPRP